MEKEKNKIQNRIVEKNKVFKVIGSRIDNLDKKLVSLDKSNDSNPKIIQSIVDELTDRLEQEDNEALELTNLENDKKAIETLIMSRKRPRFNETDENSGDNQKRQKLEHVTIEDETNKVLGGTKNTSKELPEYNVATSQKQPENNSNASQEVFNPKHVQTCPNLDRPTTSGSSTMQQDEVSPRASTSQEAYPDTSQR